MSSSSSDPAAFSPALARVARGDLCAGCGACAALAPGRVTMKPAGPGYLRPVPSAPLSDAEDRAIAEVCPGLGQSVEIAGRQHTVLWGPHVGVSLGWATDPEVRFAASSGGALSAILCHLLETAEVDAVVQTAADPAFPIGNRTVVSRERAAVLAAAGSRYAPSAPLTDLPRHVASGLRFAFVGKPCDAAALRALMARDETLSRTFPVILSFFCAGVPSHAGGRAVLEALGTGLDETRDFRFRGMGWPGRAVAIDVTGQERSMSYHDSWGGILSKHVQHRCKICADGTGTAADIVCADAWESDADGYPVFDEAPGVSLIMARTRRGTGIIAAARAAGRIATEPFDMERLAAIQPGQRERRRALLARLLALRLLRRPVPRYRGLSLWAAARQNAPSRNLHNFLGMLRRVLRSWGARE